MFKTIQCPLISEVIGEYQSYKKIIKKTRFQPIAQTTVKKINWLVRHFRKPCDWRQRHKQLSVLKYWLWWKSQGQWYGLSFHGVLTRVKLLGEAAQRLMLVRFHSCITSFVFSSTLITLSLVIPSRRGTSLFLPFIFSCRKITESCNVLTRN